MKSVHNVYSKRALWDKIMECHQKRMGVGMVKTLQQADRVFEG